jgi:hypothetical protein
MSFLSKLTVGAVAALGLYALRPRRTTEISRAPSQRKRPATAAATARTRPASREQIDPVVAKTRTPKRPARRAKSKRLT